MIDLGELRIPPAHESLPMVLSFIRGLCRRSGFSPGKEAELTDAGRRVFVRIVDLLQHCRQADHVSVGTYQKKDFLTLRFFFGESERIDISSDGRFPGLEPLSIEEAFRDLSKSGRVSCRLAVSPKEKNEVVLVRETGLKGRFEQGDSTQAELQTMLALSQSIAATIELDDLLQYLINELVDSLGAERGTIYLFDPEKQELFSKVLSQDTGDITEIRVKLGEGLAGQVAASGEVINIADAYQDERFNPSFDRSTGFHTQTLLAVPMRDPHHKLVGVVQLLNKKGGPFLSRDANLLNALAGQAAIRIEHARLYEEEIKRKVLDNEIERARQIQESFLPKEIPVIQGFDVAGKCVYSEKIGGDYFDIFPLGDSRPGRFGLVVGDVSGHGLSSALLMATARALIRLRASMPGPPSAVVTDVNRQLSQDTRVSGEFMTLFYAVIDAGNHTIEWVRAGHDPALVYDTDTGRFSDLGGLGVALGLDENYPFQEFKRGLFPGEVLLIGTDGIWETHDAEGNMFGKAPLKEAMRANAYQPAQAIVTAVNQALTSFRGPVMPEDDVTMVVIKIGAGE